jgi:hypothetical protein
MENNGGDCEKLLDFTQNRGNLSIISYLSPNNIRHQLIRKVYCWLSHLQLFFRLSNHWPSLCSFKIKWPHLAPAYRPRACRAHWFWLNSSDLITSARKAHHLQNDESIPAAPHAQNQMISHRHWGQDKCSCISGVEATAADWNRNEDRVRSWPRYLNSMPHRRKLQNLYCRPAYCRQILKIIWSSHTVVKNRQHSSCISSAEVS